jgi:hypothetical protein
VSPSSARSPLGAIGVFEREMMLERQRERIAKAKGDGKYNGRKPTARAKSDEVKALASQGVGAVGDCQAARDISDIRLGVVSACCFSASACRAASARRFSSRPAVLPRPVSAPPRPVALHQPAASPLAGVR